jgi:hypothetical protein
MKTTKLIENKTDKHGLFTCPCCKAEVPSQVRGDVSLLLFFTT